MRTSVSSTSSTEARTVSVRSLEDLHVDALRERRLQLRQERLHPVGDLDDVGARLALDVQDDGALVVRPAGELRVLDAVDRRSRRRARRTGEPFAYAMTSGLNAVGLVELVVGRERVVLARAVDVALRLVDVRGDERRRGRPRASGPCRRAPAGSTWTRTAGFWPPLMVTRPTPETCEIFCAEDRVGEVVDLVERQRRRELIASVRIGVSAGLLFEYVGGVGSVRGQQARRGVDGRLHVLLRRRRCCDRGRTAA